MSTHQHFGIGMTPDLNRFVPGRTVHPGSCSVQHGDGHSGGQQVNTVQHGPLGPTQRLWHGPETHFSAGRRNGGIMVNLNELMGFSKGRYWQEPFSLCVLPVFCHLNFYFNFNSTSIVLLLHYIYLTTCNICEDYMF